MCAESEGILALALRCREDDDVSSERARELDSHVAKSPESNHSNLLSFADAPVFERRPGGYSSAEQRRDAGQIEIGRDSEDEIFIDDNAVGLATIGNAAKMLVG